MRCKFMKPLLFLTTILFLTVSIFAQSPGVDPLDLSITMPKACYAPDETVRVQVQIANNSDNILSLFRPKKEEQLRGLRLVFIDERGKIAGNRDPIHMVHPRNLTGDEFVQIQPRDTLVEGMNFSPRLSGLRLGRVYFVYVSYESPLFENDVPATVKKDPVWTFEKPKIYSNKVEFEVRKNCH